MKPIEVLKSRLLKNNTLFVQNENGYFEEAKFEWNKPITDNQIDNFEKANNLKLPISYINFLKMSNGALLFKDIQYGQWGCKILGLDELMDVTKQVSTWGYDLKPGWIVFSTWLGDCDILVFDLNKSGNGVRNYIIDGEQGEKVDDWVNIKGDFAVWIDRLIVAQGAKYWRWY